MDKETQELIEWAEKYKPTVTKFKLNAYIQVNDLQKAINTLLIRTKRIDSIPAFSAYRDHLKKIRKYLESNE